MGRCVFFLCGQVDFGGMNEVEEKNYVLTPKQRNAIDSKSISSMETVLSQR